MGRFIVTRTASGVRFLLESAGGMALVTSRSYKNLDACKKGIASLVADLPGAPLVDATAGERAPNPKIELAASGGGYVFYVKAPNGKAVITSPVYATKKAAKRTVSMLRTAVLDPTLVLTREAGLASLTMKKTPQRGVATQGIVADTSSPVAKSGFEDSFSPILKATPVMSSVEEFSVSEITEACADESPLAGEKSSLAKASAEATSDPVVAPAVPRLIRVGEVCGNAPASASTRQEGVGVKSSVTGRATFLSRILGRK